MAGFNKFNAFVEAICEKKHNIESDTFKLMLTNTAPVATNSVKANLTEIAAGNGYVAGGNVVNINSSSQTAGVYTASVSGDVEFTASGGSIPGFRYIVCYNDTAANKDLVGFWDRGTVISLADNETFKAVTDGLVLITLS